MIEEDEIMKEVEQEYWVKNYPDIVQKLKMGLITKEEAEILRMFNTVEQRELVLTERREIEKKGKREFRNIMRGKYRELIWKKFESLMKELKINGMEIENREKVVILREFNWNKFGEGCLDDMISIERKCDSSGDSESKFAKEWSGLIENFIEEMVNKLLKWNMEALGRKLGDPRESEYTGDSLILNTIRREAEEIMKALGKFRVRKLNELDNKEHRKTMIANIRLWNWLTYEMLVNYGKIDEIVVKKNDEF